MISEGQRLQYLEAMGIQAWVSHKRASIDTEMPVDSHFPHPSEPANPVTDSSLAKEGLGFEPSQRPAHFEIGPGTGSTLLLCSRPEEAATPLASDIARCLDEAPVWGWLSQDAGGADAVSASLTLERAVDERLFTRVLLFCGDSGAGQAGKVEVLSSACIIHAPPIAELANHPEHKRRLWKQLSSHGWNARRG